MVNSRCVADNFASIVYISCFPEALARDLAKLAETHTVAEACAFDAFVGTPHLEVGVVLRRNR